MKEIIKNIKHEVIIIVIGLIIGMSIYLLLTENLEIFIAILASSISIAFGIRSSKIEGDRIFKELFHDFNEKYDSKFNDRLNLLAEENNDVKKSEIIDYINLCSEEYLWYTKGRIPENIWKSWFLGMQFYFTNPTVKKVLIEEEFQKDSYYGFFEYLKNKKVIP